MKFKTYLRQLDIRQSVFLLTACISLIYLAVGFVSLRSLMEFGNRYDDLKNNNLQATHILHEVTSAFLKLRLSSSNYYVGRTAKRDEVLALEAELKKKIESGTERFAPMADTTTEIESLREWRALYAEYLALRDTQMRMLESGREREFNEFRIEKIIPLNKKAERSLGRLVSYQSGEAAEKEMSVANDIQRSQAIITFLLVASGLLAAVLVWISVNWIARVQQQRIDAVNKLATLGAIAGDIAHEINNPLSVIMMSADMLTSLCERDSIDPAKAARLVEKIQTGSERIQKVTSGMRAFARDGSADPFVRFDLGKMLDETFAFCSDKMKRHSVAFTFENPNEAFALDGRAAELSQVMVNLLGNSVDAIADLKVRWIRVTVKDLGEKIEISILDSGSGIPEAVRNKMFKTSFTTKPVGAGTGLGLGICARIVGSHHGVIVVDAASANTRIVLTLPKAQTKLAIAS